MAATSGGDSDEYSSLGVDANDLRQFADFSLEDGTVVIYDRNDEDAWMQSASAVALDTMA